MMGRMAKKTVCGAASAVMGGPAYNLLRRRALTQRQLHIESARDRLQLAASRPPQMRARALPLRAPEVDVSVIIPVYNVEGYLRDCLDSVLAQDTVGAIEVVVVNDGSTDGSTCIAHEYDHDPRVHVIDQDNRGLSAARNAGLDAARGRTVMFVDSDDMLAPGHIAALESALAGSDADYATSLFRYMTDDGIPGKTERERSEWMAPWGRLFRREVWKDIRFPVGAWYEDLVMPLCVEPLFSECLVQSDNGYLYRERPGSITHSMEKGVKGVDSFWVLEEVAGWRESLGITYGQREYDQFLSYLGPLLLGRTVVLDDDKRRCLFNLCCDAIAGIVEFEGLSTTLPDAWRDVELALRSRNYGLWLLAAVALAARGGVGLGLSAALKIYMEGLGS